MYSRKLRYHRRAKFVDWRTFVPVLGTIVRGNKLVKSTLRADRLLKRLRVRQPKRTIAAASVGANSLLETGKMKIGGAPLYTLDRIGKGAVKGYRRSGVMGAVRGSAIGARTAKDSIAKAGKKMIAPVTAIVDSSRRAYRLLPDELSRQQRVWGSAKVGLSQLLKKNRRKGMGKKLYGADRTGRNSLRRLRRWKNKRKKR